MEIKLLGTLTQRKIGYGIVQPGDSIPNGVPVIKVNNIISGLHEIQDLDTTSSENSLKYNRTKLVGGELLVSVVGTIGKTAIVPPSFAGCNIVRAVAMIDIPNPEMALWVKYYIDSPSGKKYIQENLNTTVQPTLNVKSLVEMPIPLLEPEYMHNAIKILSTIDNKIELNNRINHNLEEQAQALFKSWFVDFEPFKEENFEDTEIGRIPKGWNVMLFKSFITASTEKVVVGDLPEYSVTNNGIIPRDQKFNKKLSQSTSKNKVLRHDNLVFGMSRDILNWGIMEDEIGSVSSAYNVYTINQDLIMPKYLRLYMMAKLPYFNDLIGTAAREGQSLDKGALFQKAVYVPPSDICHEFFNIYDRLIEMQQTAILESKQLAYYRDYILPLLLDGVLNVESVNL